MIQCNGSVKEPNKFHNYETEKITRKASYEAEYIELFGFSTRNRHTRRWKNRTTRCNRFWRAGCSLLEYVDIRLVY